MEMPLTVRAITKLLDLILEGWILTQQDFHAAYMVTMNSIQQGSPSILKSMKTLPSEQTYTTFRFGAARYALYPIVFININATVNEHLQNICVSFTARQGQGALSPFGEKIGVSTLHGGTHNGDGEYVTRQYDLNKEDSFLICFPYILKQKLNDGDLPMCGGPHQRCEAFFILEVNNILC